MNQTTVLNQAIALFLLMVVGFIIRKLRIFSRELTKGLSDLLVYVTLPFQIVISFNFSFSKGMLLNAGIVLLISILIHLLAILITKVLYYKYPPATKQVLRSVTIFSNCGFMGFPVLGSLYGDKGIFYGSFYVLVFNILIWTVGVFIFTNKKDTGIWKQIINPAVVAIIIGLSLFLASVKLPLTLFKTLEMIGSMNTPLSMLIIGSLLAEVSLTELLSGFSIFYVAFVRLLILPLLTATVLITCGIKGMLLGVPVIATAMPTAALTVVFAEKYGADALLASRAVFLSTILSIITIPLIAFLIQPFC